jgi:hypothetical protein
MPFLRFGGGALAVDAALGVNYFRREAGDRAYGGQPNLQVCVTTLAASLAVNTLFAMPYLVGNEQHITSLGVQTSAGAGNIRFGLYSNISLANPYPDALLVDSGDFAPAAGLNYFSGAPLPLTLTARTLFWLACVLPAGQTRSYSTPSRAFWPVFGRPTGTVWSTVNTSACALSAAFAYAALPATFPAGATVIDSNNAPLIPMITLVPA